jgi:hypothetical protein
MLIFLVIVHISSEISYRSIIYYYVMNIYIIDKYSKNYIIIYCRSNARKTNMGLCLKLAPFPRSRVSNLEWHRLPELSDKNTAGKEMRAMKAHDYIRDIFRADMHVRSNQKMVIKCLFSGCTLPHLLDYPADPVSR